MKKIILFTSLFPYKDNSIKGIFNLNRIKILREKGYHIKIINPIGITPPERSFPKISYMITWMYKKLKYPSYEIISGFSVYHPKWIWLPRRYFWRYEAFLLNIFAGRRIRKIIQGFNPDIIITSWFHPYSTYAKYIKKISNIPIISIFEGSDVLVYPKLYQGIKKLSKVTNNFVDKKIFVFNGLSKLLSKIFNSDNTIVLYNGYDSETFFLKHKVKIKEEREFRIVSVGNLSKIKGHDLLLKSLKLIENVDLIIVGYGQLFDEYKKFVRLNNLENRVQLLGHICHNKVKDILYQSDIFCLPSRSEGFPSAPLEAMACGLPVIATKVGGLSELIIDGFNGYLCEPESVESLVECINKAKKNTWDKQRIADFAKTNYSWEKWGEKMGKIIRSVT